MQRQYTSHFQMLKIYDCGGLLPSCPACVASGDHLAGHYVKQDVGTRGPSGRV